MSFVSYGVRIGVRAREESHLQLVADRLPPGARPAQFEIVDRLYSLLVPKPSVGPVRRFHVLYADAAMAARTHEPKEIGPVFENDLQMYVAIEAQRRIFVHAGVVGWRGRAIVIPGISFSGKSSLVASLVRAGAQYLSDEYAVLDEQGRVHPYLAPLKLRSGDPAKPDIRYAPETLGGQTPKRPLPLGLVLVTRYRAGARFRPRALTAGETALALLSNTLPAQRRPRESLQAIRQAVRGARAFRTNRGDADSVAALVLDLVGD